MLINDSKDVLVENCKKCKNVSLTEHLSLHRHQKVVVFVILGNL